MYTIKILLQQGKVPWLIIEQPAELFHLTPEVVVVIMKRCHKSVKGRFKPGIHRISLADKPFLQGIKCVQKGIVLITSQGTDDTHHMTIFPQLIQSYSRHFLKRKGKGTDKLVSDSSEPY